MIPSGSLQNSLTNNRYLYDPLNISDCNYEIFNSSPTDRPWFFAGRNSSHTILKAEKQRSRLVFQSVRPEILILDDRWSCWFVTGNEAATLSNRVWRTCLARDFAIDVDRRLATRPWIDRNGRLIGRAYACDCVENRGRKSSWKL